METIKQQLYLVLNIINLILVSNIFNTFDQFTSNKHFKIILIFMFIYVYLRLYFSIFQNVLFTFSSILCFIIYFNEFIILTIIIYFNFINIIL